MSSPGKPISLNENVSPFGSSFDGVYRFASGHEAPLIDVHTPTALTQLAGYAKYLNRRYGDVYYRGENNLHDSLYPSFARQRIEDRRVERTRTAKFDSLIGKLVKQKLVFESSQGPEPIGAAILCEAALQHYGIPTRLVDVVDNLWVALWFGSHRSHGAVTDNVEYTTYKPAAGEGAMPGLGGSSEGGRVFQYLLLMAVPNEGGPIRPIDLRRHLPSWYLRPHAQHGVVLESCEGASYHDFSECIVGILRIDVLRALRWLGTGQLVSYENLFPSPMFDHGYSKLLNNDDLSKYDLKVTRYVYSI